MRQQDEDTEFRVYFCDSCGVSARVRRGVYPRRWLMGDKDLCDACDDVAELQEIARSATDPEISDLASKSAHWIAVTKETARLLAAGVITVEEARRRLREKLS